MIFIRLLKRIRGDVKEHHCELCGLPNSECKNRTIAEHTKVRNKESGAAGVAVDMGDHIEVTFDAGKTERSLHYAKCVFFRDYVVLTKI